MWDQKSGHYNRRTNQFMSTSLVVDDNVLVACPRIQRGETNNKTKISKPWPSSTVILLSRSFIDFNYNFSDFDNNAQAMDKAIIPLARRCLVSYDGQAERFDIHDMQREFVMNNIHIRDMLGEPVIEH
jgi:hypothetical protein